MVDTGFISLPDGPSWPPRRRLAARSASPIVAFPVPVPPVSSLRITMSNLLKSRAWGHWPPFLHSCPSTTGAVCSGCPLLLWRLLLLLLPIRVPFVAAQQHHEELAPAGDFLILRQWPAAPEVLFAVTATATNAPHAALPCWRGGPLPAVGLDPVEFVHNFPEKPVNIFIRHASVLTLGIAVLGALNCRLSALLQHLLQCARQGLRRISSSCGARTTSAHAIGTCASGTHVTMVTITQQRSRPWLLLSGPRRKH